MLAWATLAAFAIALAHHLGLVSKVSEVVGQVMSCPRCSVFWGVLSLLMIEGEPLPESAFISLMLSYLTDWLGLLFNEFARIYDSIWIRRRRKKPGR